MTQEVAPSQQLEKTRKSRRLKSAIIQCFENYTLHTYTPITAYSHPKHGFYSTDNMAQLAQELNVSRNQLQQQLAGWRRVDVPDPTGTAKFYTPYVALSDPQGQVHVMTRFAPDHPGNGSDAICTGVAVMIRPLSLFSAHSTRSASFFCNTTSQGYSHIKLTVIR